MRFIPLSWWRSARKEPGKSVPAAGGRVEDFQKDLYAKAADIRVPFHSTEPGILNENIKKRYPIRLFDDIRIKRSKIRCKLACKRVFEFEACLKYEKQPD